jgi:catecholate siderophore receptor
MNGGWKQRGKARSRRVRGSQRWLVWGTALAYATAGGVSAGRAQGVIQTPAGTGTQRQFDIPAEPLADALAAWEKATGLALRVALPGSALAGLNSAGVHGELSGESALHALVAGTGLALTVGDQGWTLSLPHASTDVQVTGDLAPEITMDRFPAPLLDTPQSVTTVTQKTMQEEGVTTLRDALRNAPGISLAAGEGGSQGDNLTIRGFTARNDIFLDGMRDFGSYYRDPFDYEQVDVLEGPSGVSFGRGSTGGVINQETKQPVATPFVAVETDGGTDLTRRFTVDVNKPLPALGHGTAFRLNLMGDEGGVAERDVTENRRYGLAPSLAFGLGAPTRVTIDYFRFQENDIPDYGIPWYFNGAAPVARHNYYGFRQNYLKTDVNMLTVRAEHDVAGWLTLHNQARYANNERNALITEPQVNNATAGAITPATPLSQVVVNRNQIAVYSNESFLWDQLDGTARVNFWGIKHLAVIGAEGGRETSDPRRPTYNYVNAAGATVNSVPTTSLLAPDEEQRLEGTSAPSSDVHTASTSYGIYLLDTMQFGRRWELVGGARFDRFLTNEKSISYPTPVVSATGARTQGAPTITYPSQLVRRPSYRAALVYKARPNGSVYFGYGTSFNPSAETFSLTVGPNGSGTANLAPETNRSFELGTKWELHNERIALRGDLFQTTMENAREASPTNSLVYVLAGTQRVRGAEAVVTGRVTDRWQVLSSYTFMHSDVVNSQYYPASIGYKLANVPDHLFNLWTTYRPQTRVLVGVGSNFVASRTASSTVPLDPTTGLIRQVPGYWVFSAMGTYSISEHVGLQANVFNLLNRNYIDQIHPGHLVPGAGTSGLFGLNFRF